MNDLILYAADIVAICALTFGVYFPRHRRRDLLTAFIGVNVGVLAVSAALSTSAVGAGLGLGLFGVLSIIRLRSSELEQHEVVYYFAALALGLLGGLGSSVGITVGLMALIVFTLYITGLPVIFKRYRQQTMLLDSAYVDEGALKRHLEAMLGARVHVVTVHKVDLVNDTTLLDVRFQLNNNRPSPDGSHDNIAGTNSAGRLVGVGR